MSATRLAIAAGLVLCLALPAAAQKARPPRDVDYICGNGYFPRQSPTLVRTVETSPVVLYGQAVNVRTLPDGTDVTEFVVLDALKGGDWVAGKKVVELAGHVPAQGPNGPPRVVVFAEVHWRN